jgi:signal peptidase
LKPAISRILKSSYVKTILLAIILLAGVFAFWFGLKAFFRTDYPLLAVASGSMMPTLNIGDLIVVQGILDASKVKAAPAPEGDIIVFRKPGAESELIVHRAISKVENNGVWYFQTKGDHNPTSDRWIGQNTWNYMISEKLLVGKVVSIVPWLGHIPLFMRTPTGIVIIISLIALLIIIDFIFPSRKNEKAESQEK